MAVSKVPLAGDLGVLRTSCLTSPPLGQGSAASTVSFWLVVTARQNVIAGSGLGLNII